MATAVVVLLLCGCVVGRRPAEGHVLALSVSVPHGGGRKHIIKEWAEASHFHVFITNVSPSAQAVWRESCSLGYQTLRFEFALPDGEHVFVSRKARHWTRNSPEYWLLQPGESLVLDIYFASGEWGGFPLPSASEQLGDQPEAWTGRAESVPTGSTLVRMRAVFASGDDRDVLLGWEAGWPPPLPIWHGRIASDWDEYVISHRCATRATGPF
jgi:hypothetical protein